LVTLHKIFSWIWLQVKEGIKKSSDFCHVLATHWTCYQNMAIYLFFSKYGNFVGFFLRKPFVRLALTFFCFQVANFHIKKHWLIHEPPKFCLKRLGIFFISYCLVLIFEHAKLVLVFVICKKNSY
jgi:hypothetical protein